MSEDRPANMAPSLQRFADQLRERMAFFSASPFDQRHDALLKAFADIIHFDHSLNRFFQICVVVPPLLGELEAHLYLLNKKADQLECVCTSKAGLLEPRHPAREGMQVTNRVYTFDDRLVFPLLPRKMGTEEDFPDTGKTWPVDWAFLADPYFSPFSLLGEFVIGPVSKLSDKDRSFFRVLTSWMGYKLNNRLIADHLEEHLRFLNSLGRDIGHNIIIPNMRLKYLLRQLEKKILQFSEIEARENELIDQGLAGEQCVATFTTCRQRRRDLEDVYGDLLKQHTQITLYLESIFRQEHFTQGHLVLQPRQCYVERDIILPQLELFRERFEKQGITIDRPKNMVEQQFPLMVDLGLLSQVYANLFSNAVKYTGEIIDHQGRPRKAVAYGAEKIPDFPEAGKTGIKFNVFTTGQPLSPEACQQIFEEGERGPNTRHIKGTGHGLDFIRRVIEVHGGQVGCEPTPEGNNFYFILPLSEEEADGCRDQRAPGPGADHGSAAG